MFQLGIVPKEILLAYSTQFVFSTIRLVPGNVVMVAIDMCGKSPITGEWIYGITWKHVYFNIFVVFIVHTTSVLKLVFPTIVFPAVSILMVTLVAVLLPLLLLLLLLLLFYFFRYFFYLFIHLFFFLFFCFVLFFIYLFIYLFIIFSSYLTVILIFVALVAIATVAFVVGVIVAFFVCWVIVVANLMLMFSILVLLFVPSFTVNSVDK